MKQITNPKFILVFTIIVASLGYFVDLYDILLFTVVRKASLLSLGVSEIDSLNIGLDLLNWQVIGLVLGGIFWGVLGDKKGRLSVLFGSILIYSIANIANGFIQSIDAYRALRFLAGLGLAGELGAGITIVSETMSAQNRGYGTMVITMVGMLGAVAASFIGIHFEWRTAYIIGGVMGLCLLLLRISVFESSLFKKMKNENISRGNILLLIKNKKIFLKYIRCILIGLPTYFIVGLLLTAVPEFGKVFGLSESPSSAIAVIVTYTSISLAEILCATISQRFKSRRVALGIFLTITLIGIFLFLIIPPKTINSFYFRFVIMGIGIGFWVTMITNATEQFGTNLRATVTTSVPNIIRGLLYPVNLVFLMLKPSLGLVTTCVIIGFPCMILALVSVYYSEETFGVNLDYTEN
ncbi:MAG: MFS transporter [Candidatus Kapabacteria bacterium]|nr:MFS transporter [Candidatus Kapabacteria bacterium]